MCLLMASSAVSVIRLENGAGDVDDTYLVQNSDDFCGDDGDGY